MIDSEYVAKFRDYERSLQTGPKDERIAHCVNRFMDVMFPLVLELKPTREEWEAMINWIAELGPVNSKLVLWLIGLTQLVEEINSNLSPEATQIGVEGPFFCEDAPVRSFGEGLSEETDDTEWLFLEGTVTDLSGQLLSDVVLDVWAANPKGTYSNFDPNAVPFDCRGRIRTNTEGRYVVKIPMPGQYGIEGPGADLLKALGRQLMRPRHVHFIIDHPGYEKLIMQVVFEGDPYARIDSALAVKEDHIIPIQRSEDTKEMKARGVSKPFYLGTYDFKLQPAVLRSVPQAG